MQKIVIIVSFGTKDEKAQASLKRIENRLSSLSPYPVLYAYSSHSITNATKERKNIETIIEENKERDIIIMPLMIQNGGEYEKILSFGYKTAKPLLGGRDSIERVARVINDTLEKQDGMKYLLIAHGEEGRARKEYEIIASLLRPDITLATLKGDECYKNIEIEEDGVHIIPFLLVYGHHAKHDIKEEVIPYFKEKGKLLSMSECGILEKFEELEGIFESNFTSLLDEDDSLLP